MPKVFTSDEERRAYNAEKSRRSKGGDSRPNNIQVVPATWNRRKSNVTAERFIGA